MSASIFQNREAYLQNTYFQTHQRERGDFTPFYVTVTICSLLFAFIIILNVVLGCCSRYSTYWADRHTGNRWIVSLWTATPHKQPALDYTELKYVYVPPVQQDYQLLSWPPAYEPTPSPSPTPIEPPAQIKYSKATEALELQQTKKESAI